MSIRNGKYFYSIEHPKPNLADIPPSCKSLLKKNEEIYDFDFKKFQQPSYQSSAFRLKSTISKNQNTNDYNSSNNRNNDILKKKKINFTSNFDGGLNFDYNNLQIDSNYGSKNDKSYKNGYEKSSKNDNFFSNKISMVPPPGDNLYIDKSNRGSNYNADNGASRRQNNYDNRSSNYNGENNNTTNYRSNSNKYNLDSQPKHSSIQNYDYIDKTSSKSNASQASRQTHQSKASNQYTSNTRTNIDNSIPQSNHTQNNFTTKTNAPSNANKYSTTNSTFTSKINSSSKTSSTRQSSLYSNDIESNSKYSKKTTAYDYSKPNPAGVYNPDTSSHTKSYKSSNAHASASNTISDRNNYNIQNQPSSVRHGSTSVTSSASNNISSRNNYNIHNEPPSIRQSTTSMTSTVSNNVSGRNNYNIQNPLSSIRQSTTSMASTSSNNISGRNNYNIQNPPSSIHHTTSSITSSTSNNISGRNNFKNQPSSISTAGTSTTTTSISSRQQYTSNGSTLTTNSVRGSKSSVSNQNSRFTTTSDLLNQGPQNYGNSSQFQSTMQKQTRTSMKQPLYEDIRPPNLTQYNRPQAGSSSAFSNNTVTTTTTTSTNSQAQFIAHQAQYSGNKDIPSNPPTQSYLRKSAISNPGYDFLQSNLPNQSQSQSIMNEGAAGNDSFTIDPVPKKTRVEFPEPQTAPKPFQMIDASLEGEVSQEEVKKVEDINELMKSFNADSDPENNLENVDDINSTTDKNKTGKGKPTSSFKIDDLKKDLFSSLFEEEEEEAQLDMDAQDDNEKNNQPLEDLSVFDDIEQKSKDFDDQNINNQIEEELDDQEANKLEIASSEDSPNDSTLPKDQKNIKSSLITNINIEEEEEDMMNIQNFFDKIKKSIGNEEEEEENTIDFIKQLENENYNSQNQNQQQNHSEGQTDENLIEDDHIEEDFNEDNLNKDKLADDAFFEEEEVIMTTKTKKQKQSKNKEEIQNEDKTVEDVFPEEEENESMIEKVNADIYLSDDDYDENKISIEKIDNETKVNNKNDLDNEFKLDMDNEEEDSETDASIEAIIKKANEQHLISDENYEEEEESFTIEENKTPTSHFKKPLKFLAKNITNKYSSNNGLQLPFEFADKILKRQLKKILSL